jgi:hypothetical protein
LAATTGAQVESGLCLRVRKLASSGGLLSSGAAAGTAEPQSHGPRGTSLNAGTASSAAENGYLAS